MLEAVPPGMHDTSATPMARLLVRPHLLRGGGAWPAWSAAVGTSEPYAVGYRATAPGSGPVPTSRVWVTLRAYSAPTLRVRSWCQGQHPSTFPLAPQHQPLADSPADGGQGAALQHYAQPRRLSVDRPADGGQGAAVHHNAQPRHLGGSSLSSQPAPLPVRTPTTC
jgi:hypothetical protein